MSTREIKTYCRFCHAYCPMVATVQGNRLLGVAPDTDNPVYGGYTCVKGRQMVEQIYHPGRLQQSQKRTADGGFEAIDTQQALDEIARQLQSILERYGPRSVASYNGTYSYQNSASHAVARAFHQAVGSPSYYASVTIDQPAKVAIGPARMGWWGAGGHMWCDSDVALIIGNNTLVSHYSIPGGIPSFSPADALREGRKRGLKVICVDPRRTEVASRSDLHLQVKPGHDAALVAAIIHVVLTENLHDEEFCQQHVRGLEELSREVAGFTPAAVAAAAGVSEDGILQAARMFAGARRGSAVTGTGPEMGPHANLLQHLVQALNAICGRYYRAGERVPNPGVLTAPGPRYAQAYPPQPGWLRDGVRSRIREDVGELFVLSPYGPQPEMPTALLPDEILTPGEGQVKALLCIGGNPLLAWPDQLKTHRALAELELLVCIDIKMAETARMAHYVIAPKICLEREDVTLLTDIWYDQPYSQYTPTVVEAEGDQIEEWELYWELGRRMGLDLQVNGEPVDMENKPAKFDLLKAITRGSRVPIDTIRDTEGGGIFPIEDVIAQPADPATASRLELYPEGLADELAAAHADLDAEADPAYPFRLVSRRLKYTYNSTGPELSMLGGKQCHNPAYMHPDDLKALGVADGELVEIRSRRGAIPAVAAASPDVRPGVVSFSHCWGGTPDPAAATDDRVREIGSNTNRLIDNLADAQKYSGMPRQSNIPVDVRRLA